VAPARAAEEMNKPVFVVRLKSLDAMLSDAQYLAGLAGKGEEAKQGMAILKGMIGEKGLEGIDTKRPIGFYSGLTEGVVDSPMVVMVPVADEDAVMEVVKKFGVKAEKDDNGIYEVTMPRLPVGVYFRFANKYAYVTFGKIKNIKGDAALKPEIIFTGDDNAFGNLTVNLDQIPTNLKDMVLTQTERKVADFKEQKLPGETETQREFRLAVVNEVMNQLKGLLKDGKSFNIRLNVDQKAGELSLTTRLIGADGSELGNTIADLGKGPSLAAGIITGQNAAVSLRTHVSLPGKLRKTLEPVIDETMEKLLKKENDKVKKELMEIVLKAVAPTAKSAELDGGFSLTGPGENDLYTVLLGIKVKDGSDIEKSVRQVLEKGPAEVKGIVKLDVEKAGGVNIHQITPPQYDAKHRKVLGENPIYFAVRDDAIIVASGERGLAELKSALSSEPKPGSCFHMELSLAKLAPVMDDKIAAAAAKKAFEKGTTDDKIVVVFHGGKAAELRMSMKAQVVKFIALTDEMKKAER
jgi:hypothetical protein